MTDHLIEIFLPLAFASKEPIPDTIFTVLKEELVDHFGGVTSCSRVLAEGLWANGDKIEADRVMVWEVMTDDLDRDWWKSFRTRVEKLLRQEELLIRATKVDPL